MTLVTDGAKGQGVIKDDPQIAGKGRSLDLLLANGDVGNGCRGSMFRTVDEKFSYPIIQLEAAEGHPLPNISGVFLKLSTRLSLSIKGVWTVAAKM